MAKRSSFQAYRDRELGKQADERIEGVLVLKMQDGSTVELSRKEIGRGEKNNSILAMDFTGEQSCPRCGGCHDNRGVFETGGWLKARIYDMDAQNWHSVMFACNCIYGAWCHTTQKLQYADNRSDIPPLTQAELNALDAVRVPGETYLEAAECLLEKFDPAPLQEIGFSKKFRPCDLERIEAGMREMNAQILYKLNAWKRLMVYQEHLL